MENTADIIDLFAGPGGLGEGFSAFAEGRCFRIAMSVEKDAKAHLTLTHRAFFRALDAAGKRHYAEYVRCVHVAQRAGLLARLKEQFHAQWEHAQQETLGQARALGNAAAWEKRARGEPVPAAEAGPTTDERVIFERMAQIRASGRPCVVIGGPPCQAYSNSGRSRNKGIRDYSPERDHRFFLFEEYRKVLDAAEPDVFVMENVEGILSARFGDGSRVFPHVLRRLASPREDTGRRPALQYDIYSFVAPPDGFDRSGRPLYRDEKQFVIKANRYGIPQSRHRVILLGIHNRHGPVTTFWGEGSRSGAPTVGDMIGSMPRIRSGSTETDDDSLEAWCAAHEQLRQELLRGLDGLVDPSITTTLRAAHAEPGWFDGDGRGSNLFVPSAEDGFSPEFSARRDEVARALRAWIRGGMALRGFANHRAKGHMASDRMRYMFSAAWAAANTGSESPSPKSRDFPEFLAPDHRNWKSGHHADRFRCMAAHMVAKTVTSHMNRDGHAYIHYSPIQNRSLTVREAARLQTFPDDYVFEGSPKDQFQQVGNAVPPYLALKIAGHVAAILREKGLL
jgi:DNA (cytosine-5)-methyltransferase 1